MTAEEFLKIWSDDSPMLVVNTSGSTGTPKPIEVEKRRMLASAKATCDFLGLKAGDRALLCLPLDYIAGKMMMVRAIERGLEMTAVPPSGHPLATVLDRTFDIVAMVPMQVYNSLEEVAERECLSRIRNLIIGGGAIDPALESRLRDMPNRVWSTYGMTETLSHIAMRRVSGDEACLWYTPFDGVAVSVDDRSRLVIDAPAVCSDVLVTNDIAEIGGDGRFRIIGRVDNVVCCGGLKIHIEEVEARIASFTSIPFMIGKSADEKFGEVMTIYVEGSESQLSEVKSLCERHLDKHQRPKRYTTISQLPYTLTGKPARTRLP